MTNMVAATIGSGTLPQTRAILPVSQRGNELLGEGVRTGVQVMVGNPEDLIAVDIFAASGISVGTTTPVQILSPGTNPLPRSRSVSIFNVTAGADVYIGPRQDFNFTVEGYPLFGANAILRKVDIPLLHNQEVWALAANAVADVRIIVY